MKKKYTATILATALLFSLGGCAKDEQHHTPHPDKGVVAISVDLPQGDEEEEGTGYTVEIDGTTADGHEGRYTVSDPLPPGEYTVLAYNEPEGITMTDGIARVERTDGTVRALTDFINPLPDYLYSGTERAITGTLSGVAEAYDLRNETLYGEAVSTRPTFTRSGDKVSADLRLLGIMGDAQTLSILLTFSNGDTQSVESDLTEVLAGFNGSTEPFALTGNLRTPVEGGFAGSIDGWQQVDGGNTDAH